MREKSIALLIVFLLGLFPQAVITASPPASRSFEDALTMMYISDAILLPEEEIDDSVSSLGLLSLNFSNPAASEADPLMARIIHAKKQERNDLDAAYRLLSSQLKSEGKDCEADLVKARWQEQRDEINTTIGFLHKVRGDRRKIFTRIWHSIKRSAQGFWSRIGAVGRNILRKVGPAMLQMVASGGTLSGSVIRDLVKHEIKSIARDRIKQVIIQGVQRLIQGQLNLAQAAGVDLCDPDGEEKVEDGSQPDVAQEESDSQIQLPESGIWELTCTFTIPPLSYHEMEVFWDLVVDWETRTWNSTITGVTIDTSEEDWHSDWSADLKDGQITELGYFTGTAAETDQIYSYGRNVDNYERTLKWIGAISSDLDRICLYRGADKEWMTPEWIEETGRAEFIASEGGFCEGLCLTGQNP